MFATVGLQTAIWNNNFRSVLLLVLYPLLLAGVVWLCVFASLFGFAMETGSVRQSHVYQSQQYGALPYSTTTPRAIAPYARVIAAQTNEMVLEYLPMIVGGVALWFLVAYFLHDRMIRAMAGARAVNRQQEPALYNLLENLCISRGLPIPHLSVIETHARNAFASGICNNTYEITVTRGLLNALKPDEVEAVLAHELTHIINRDTRLMIISVIFVGMLGFLTQSTWRILRSFTRTGGSAGRRSGKGGGQIILVLLAIGCVLWIGYMATLLTRFALSRRREYMADAGAVELTKNPDGLIRALQRIAGREELPDMPADVKMLCLHNHSAFLGLFSTHPPLEQRIQELAALNGLSRPDIYTLPPAAPDESFQPQDDRMITPARKRIRNPKGWSW